MVFRSLGHMLTALLIVILLATGATAAVQVRVTPAASSGAVGSTITVTVEADSVADLGGFQFGFTYSATDLQAVSANINPAFDNVVAQNMGTATGSGMIAATVFDNSPVTGSSVTLATIDFRIVTPVSGGVTLNNVILGQVGGTEISSTAVGGTVAGFIPIVPSYTVTFISGGNGNLTGTTSQTVTSGANATTVTAVPAIGYHFVNWTEGSTVISSTASLTINGVTTNHGYMANFAADPVNGLCGSSNGQTQGAAPAADLCATGTASAVSGNGPWSWSCNGLNGGGTANCSASILQGPATTAPVITFNPLTDVTYGDAPFDPGAVSSLGHAISYASSNPAVAGIIGNMIQTTGIGSSTITASEADVTGSALAPDVSRGLTVKPATLFVTAQSTTKSFSSHLPAFNVAYTGFAPGENSSVLTGSPFLSTTATSFSPVGSYPIMVSQGTLSAANYTFSFVNGTLNITEVAADSDGKTVAPIAVETASGSKVAIEAGTRLKDAAGNPISGPLTLTSTAAGSLSSLPQNVAIGQATGGKSLVSLAVSIDLNISANGVSVKTIDPSMVINVAIPIDYAKPEETVEYYSFDGTAWNLEESANVKSDGTIDMKVGHLSIWAVAKFKKLPSGKIALNGTTSAVNVADALRALQIAVGMIQPSENDLAEGDVAPLVNGRPSPNNQINVGDAIIILQKSLGIVGW